MIESMSKPFRSLFCLRTGEHAGRETGLPSVRRTQMGADHVRGRGGPFRCGLAIGECVP